MLFTSRNQVDKMQESETNVNIYHAFRAIKNTNAVSYCEHIGGNTTHG